MTFVLLALFVSSARCRAAAGSPAAMPWQACSRAGQALSTAICAKIRRMKTIRSVVGLCGALLLAACPSGTDGSTDAGANDAGSGPTDAGGGSSKPGFVFLSQSALGTSGSASFLDGPTYSTSVPCASQTFGGCVTSLNCDVTQLPPPDAGVRFVSAGTITLEGTKLDGGATMELSTSSNSYSKFWPQQLWAGGEAITIKLQGAAVPASQQAITAPSTISLTAPSCDAGVCADVARSADLAVTWSGGSSGKVQVLLATSNVVAKTASTVLCSFDASASRGTIPTAAITGLSVGKASMLVFNQNLVDTTTTDGRQIRYVLSTAGASASIMLK